MNDNEFFLHVQDKLMEIENAMQFSMQKGGGISSGKNFFLQNSQTIFVLVTLGLFCLILSFS